MKKGYLITISTFILFFLLISLVNYYSEWNYRVERHVSKVKSLDKMPFLLDDVSSTLKNLMQVDVNFTNTNGELTTQFKDTLPAPQNISELLEEYESFLEGEYSAANNVELQLNQTSLLSQPRIEFSNGLTYEYTDGEKNGVFFYGGWPYTTELTIRIRANKKWNNTQENWTWNDTGDLLVTLDIKDSTGNPIYINGSTQGRISSSTLNEARILFAPEGTEYPELRIKLGRVNGENGAVLIERERLVNFGMWLTAKTTNYGPIRASLPATLYLSDGIVNMVGSIVLGEA